MTVMEIPFGIIANTGAIVIAGLLGVLLKNKIPSRIIETLPVTLGLAAMTIGIAAILKLKTVPVVVLSLIIGSIIGELCNIDRNLLKAMRKLQKYSIFSIRKEQQEIFITLLVLFGASGTGIFGALHAGMTGDNSILLAKSVLDFFTAISFATTLGFIVSILAIPQFIIQFLLYYFASLVLPLVTDSMLANFQATGGVITFAIGLKIATIKDIRVVNLIPALFIVFFITALWERPI
ncbi:MAG: DUF554 domain-containing protein [Sphaerochaeta sp.]|nr:DUF554 domain-containing protein [Sphaerochaeta sp.]